MSECSMPPGALRQEAPSCAIPDPLLSCLGQQMGRGAQEACKRQAGGASGETLQTPDVSSGNAQLQSHRGLSFPGRSLRRMPGNVCQLHQVMRSTHLVRVLMLHVVCSTLCPLKRLRRPQKVSTSRWWLIQFCSISPAWSWLVEQSWTYCVLVEPHGLIDPHGYFLEVLLWSSLISQINLGIFPSASKPMPKFELRC